MSTEKNKCCLGFKNGQPGQNINCQKKLMMENLEEQRETSKEETKHV
ncbi:MAG: hypothetical protein ACSHW7_12950 [Patiriisocius sp.]